jgi:hypothetical protein
MDNIFIERLRRSLKYEEVYLKDYESVTEARALIEKCSAGMRTERRFERRNGSGWPRCRSRPYRSWVEAVRDLVRMALTWVRRVDRSALERGDMIRGNRFDGLTKIWAYLSDAGIAACRT